MLNARLPTCLVSAMLTLIMAGCVDQPKVLGTDVDTGRMLFASNCAACHGSDGKGAGPEALGLGAPPPDLTILALQNRGRFPRAYVIEIVAGKVGPDHPTAAMPEFWTAELGRLVQVTSDGKVLTVPAGLLAVTNYLESIQQP